VRRAHTVILQEQHDAADLLVLFPGPCDRRDAGRAESVDLEKPFVVVLDDLERLSPELRDDPARELPA